MLWAALIFGSIAAVLAGWTILTDRWLVGCRAPRGWRVALWVFSVLHALALVSTIVHRLSGWKTPALPGWLHGSILLWCLVCCPAALIWTTALLVGRWWLRRKEPRGTPGALSTSPVMQGAQVSRRGFLAGAAGLAAPAVHTGLLLKSFADEGTIRTREFTLPVAGLHPALEGLTIAHVSDTHVGRITHGAVLDHIALRTNDLKPDVIVFTGDLIDQRLRDLPEALAMLRKMRAPLGMVLCEGNHDLFDNGRQFRADVRAAGHNLLLNESMIVDTGRGGVLHVMGLAWGNGRPTDTEHAADGAVLGRLLREGKALAPTATSVLLSHHPHAFDAAAGAGVPITFAGHTHGGQLMFAPGVGPAAAKFRYISGLYTKPGAALLVSNGVGNWFPLRVNAPAEILRVTLARA